MRCGFCHNAELACASPITGVVQEKAENIYFTENEIFAYLEKRAKLISGVVISGGEPFISPILYGLIKKIKALKLAVKIDTNGLFPQKLEKVLYDKTLTPDMVAIDIKTAPERYGELMGRLVSVSEADLLSQKLLNSLTILEKFKNENPYFEVEYRTVLVPGLIGEKEIKKIASVIPKSAVWRFANFIPGNCLDKTWNKIKQYSTEELKSLTESAKLLIQDSELR